jgi:tetratricopeptide (TPR) repeat protein
MLTPDERSRRLLEDAFRLSEEGRLQSAIHACQQAISLNPTSTSAHSLLGTLYERSGDRNGAIREYEQVLTLSPGSTVERRRLNELMGVAAAPEQIAVSPRTARMAVTGGFVVVALILIAALVFTSHQPQRSRREMAVARASRRAQQPAAAGTAQSQVAPARLVGSGRARAPSPAPPRYASLAPAQAQWPASQGYGQWIGPGAFLLPSGGREPYVGAGTLAQAGRIRPPIQGAVRVRARGAPTVNTPSWRYPSGVTSVPGAAVPRLARNYYFQRNYQASIEAYRGYLATNPQAPAPRQELAWVYMESGDRQTARQQYGIALDQYQSDLSRGHNVEAARHGARTCESAINALEAE